MTGDPVSAVQAETFLGEHLAFITPWERATAPEAFRARLREGGEISTVDGTKVRAGTVDPETVTAGLWTRLPVVDGMVPGPNYRLDGVRLDD